MTPPDTTDYKLVLKDAGLLDTARKWLNDNPPPPEWRADKWAYAFTEMPVLFGVAL